MLWLLKLANERSSSVVHSRVEGLGCMIYRLLWRTQQWNQRKESGRAFSAWRQGGPGSVTTEGTGTKRDAVPCRVIERLCKGFAVGSIVFRKTLLPPERTKQLLFQGAQACRDHVLGEGCSIIHLPESLKPGLTGAPQATRGQMLIGPDGRLTRCQTQASEAGEWLPVVLAGYCT